MSVAQLARGADIRYAAAHSWYHGKPTRYDAYILDRICMYLNVQVGDILVYIPNTTRIDSIDAGGTKPPGNQD